MGTESLTTKNRQRTQKRTEKGDFDGVSRAGKSKNLMRRRGVLEEWKQPTGRSLAAVLKFKCASYGHCSRYPRGVPENGVELNIVGGMLKAGTSLQNFDVEPFR